MCSAHAVACYRYTLTPGTRIGLIPIGGLIALACVFCISTTRKNVSDEHTPDVFNAISWRSSCTVSPAEQCRLPVDVHHSHFLPVAFCRIIVNLYAHASLRSASHTRRHRLWRLRLPYRLQLHPCLSRGRRVRPYAGSSVHRWRLDAFPRGASF